TGRRASRQLPERRASARHDGQRAGTKVQAPQNTDGAERLRSLAEKASAWKAVTPSSGMKRKAAVVPAKTPAQKSKIKSGVGAPPSWTCRAVWYGDPCRRIGCRYEHIAGSPITPEATSPAATPRQTQQTLQQQQQQPQQPQQQPQQQLPLQQPQAAAGSGHQQGSVANFSRISGG
ncbi:unnamed protein product, partial [Pylaiella littoralis]